MTEHTHPNDQSGQPSEPLPRGAPPPAGPSSQPPSWLASTPPPTDPVSPAPPVADPAAPTGTEPSPPEWSRQAAAGDPFAVPPGPNGEPFFWAEPHAPSRRLKMALAAGAAFIGAGLAAGITVAVLVGGGASPSTSVATGQPIVQGAPAASTGASSPDQGIVDINTQLSYQGAYAAGTGMIVTSNGEVLTNNHVIAGATQIKVTVVTTGHTYSANVVGYDVTGDIAVLQMQGASGLQTVALGDSSTVKVGDSVLAVGNAQGAGGLPSEAPGRVTALNQSITASDPGAGRSEQLSGLIETNANLQPGDSGGPLLNSSNQVVGMDTAASSSNGGYGLQVSGTDGYAIPINTAVTIANQIVAGTESSTIHVGSTGFLGVQVAPAGSYFGYSQASGALVVGVEPSSPAATAGIQAGDSIVSLNGKAVQSSSALSDMMASTHGGQSISITWVDQSGTQHSTTIKLASGPAQ